MMEYVTLAIRLLIRHEFEAYNRYTTAPLVINMHNLIDLAKKAFPASKSNDTSKKM